MDKYTELGLVKISRACFSKNKLHRFIFDVPACIGVVKYLQKIK